MTEDGPDPRAMEKLASLTSFEEAVQYSIYLSEHDDLEDGPYRATIFGGCELLATRWEPLQASFMTLADLGWNGLSEEDDAYPALFEPIQQLNTLFPEMFEVRLAICTLLIALGNWEHAVGALEALIDTFPDKAGLRVDLAKLYVMEERWDNALEHLDGELELGKPRWDLRRLRALALGNLFAGRITEQLAPEDTEQLRELLTEAIAEAEAALGGAPAGERADIEELLESLRTREQVLATIGGPADGSRDTHEPDPDAADDPTRAEPVNGPPRWDFTIAETEQVDALEDWPRSMSDGERALWERRTDILATFRGSLAGLQCRSPHPVRAWMLAKLREHVDALELGFFLFPTPRPTRQVDAVAQLIVFVKQTDTGDRRIARAWVDALGEDELSEDNRRAMAEASQALAAGDSGHAGSAAEAPVDAGPVVQFEDLAIAAVPGRIDLDAWPELPELAFPFPHDVGAACLYASSETASPPYVAIELYGSRSPSPDDDTVGHVVVYRGPDGGVDLEIDEHTRAGGVRVPRSLASAGLERKPSGRFARHVGRYARLDRGRLELRQRSDDRIVHADDDNVWLKNGPFGWLKIHWISEIHEVVDVAGQSDPDPPLDDDTKTEPGAGRVARWVLASLALAAVVAGVAMCAGGS